MDGPKRSKANYFGIKTNSLASMVIQKLKPLTGPFFLSRADRLFLGYNYNVIYSLSGKIEGRQQNFAIINVHGVGLKVFASPRTLGMLNGEVSVFTHLHVKEDALDLYGFLSKNELIFFEQLISISGVGPKSALSIMEVDELHKLIAAIQEGRPDLLTQASGIGRKTAERIIIELRGKVGEAESAELVKTMDSDADIVETLVSLGYKKDVVRGALSKIDSGVVEMEPRLKAALKILNTK